MNTMDVDTRPPPSWKPSFGFGLKKLANAMSGGNNAVSAANPCAGSASMHCWQPAADNSGVVDAPQTSCGNGTILGCAPMVSSRQVSPAMPTSSRFYGQPGCQGCASLQHRHEVEKAQLATQLADAETRSSDLKQQVVSLQKQLDELKAFAAPLLAVNCVMGSLPSMCAGLLTDNKNCLGSGSYGTAHEWSLQSDTVVVKEIHLKKSSMENVAYEVGLTSLINHPNVVKSLGWWMGGRTTKQADAPVEACVLLMMERCEGSLADCLDQGLFHHTDTLQPKDVKELLEFAYGLCKAVAHIHQLGVIHNDITVNNVFPKKCLKTGVAVAKLGDFGLSLPIPEGSYTGRSRGTPELSAPELLRDARCACHSRASDVYSLGGTLWELFTCRPWRWLNSNNQFEINALYPHVPAAPSGLSELIVRMMAPVAADRPSMDVVLARMGQLLQQPIVPSRSANFITAPMPASVSRGHKNAHLDANCPVPKRAPPTRPASKGPPTPDTTPAKRAPADRTLDTHLPGKLHVPENRVPSPVDPMSSNLSVATNEDDDSPMMDAPDLHLLCSQPSDASTSEFLSFNPGSHELGQPSAALYQKQQDLSASGSWLHSSVSKPGTPASNESAQQHAMLNSPHVSTPSKSPTGPYTLTNPASVPGCPLAATHALYAGAHRPRNGNHVIASIAGGSSSSGTELASNSGASTCSLGTASDADAVPIMCAPPTHKPLDVCMPESGEEGDVPALPPLTPSPQPGMNQFVNSSSSNGSHGSSHSSCPSRDMFTL